MLGAASTHGVDKDLQHLCHRSRSRSRQRSRERSSSSKERSRGRYRSRSGERSRGGSDRGTSSGGKGRVRVRGESLQRASLHVSDRVSSLFSLAVLSLLNALEEHPVQLSVVCVEMHRIDRCVGP